MCVIVKSDGPSGHCNLDSLSFVIKLVYCRVEACCICNEIKNKQCFFWLIFSGGLPLGGHLCWGLDDHRQRVGVLACRRGCPRGLWEALKESLWHELRLEARVFFGISIAIMAWHQVSPCVAATATLSGCGRDSERQPCNTGMFDSPNLTPRGGGGPR